MQIDVTKDVNAVADHLRLCIQAKRITLRTVERELGMGEGYLGQLLRGNLDLKMKHVMAVLRVIGMEPEEFFSSLYSGTFPVERLRPLPASPPRSPAETFPGRRADEVVPGVSENELERLIAKTLARLGVLEAGGEEQDRRGGRKRR